MRLRHYSPIGVGRLFTSPQVGDSEPLMKPRGLWLSCDDYEMNWQDWCEAEEFRVADLARSSMVELRPDARILYLRSDRDIDEFTREYNYLPFGGVDLKYIDWARVARTYQGIVIAPYSWSRRMEPHTFWYYGWDCASGCVWDASCVASVRFDTEAFQVRLPATRWTREVRARLDWAGFWLSGESDGDQLVVGLSTSRATFFRHDSTLVLRAGPRTRRLSLLRRLFDSATRRRRYYDNSWISVHEAERAGLVVHDSKSWTG